MESAALIPVPGLPVLQARPRRRNRRNWLAVADLHLGLGASGRRADGPPEASRVEIASLILEAARRTRARGLVIVGDVKHPIVGTPQSLRPVLFDFFADLLGHGLNVEVVLGNHDPGVTRYLPREVVVHPSSGIVRDGVGLFHGHRWPSKEVLDAERLVVGHLHPGFRLAGSPDHPAGRFACWIRVRYPPPLLQGPRAHGRRFRATELIVVPPVNPLAGIEALNREKPRRGRSFLFGRFLKVGEARAYLLDGTDLGRVG